MSQHPSSLLAARVAAAVHDVDLIRTIPLRTHVLVSNINHVTCRLPQMLLSIVSTSLDTGVRST